MLGCVPFAFLEFWEILNDSLHVLNRVELSLTLFCLQELLDHIMDGIRHVSKVRIHYLLEKAILIAGESHFLHLVSQMGQMPQVNSVILYSQQLVNHGLVSPLIQ